MAQWLSWLERRPVTAEVESSSLFWVVHIWGLSSAGRASALQAEGHRFEPYRPHLCFAGVVELADTRDLKSLGLNIRAGSSPATRSISEIPFSGIFFCVIKYIDENGKIFLAY